MITAEMVATLYPICPGAKLMVENNQQFIFLPDLKIQVRDQVKNVNALLCPSDHSGYVTRLFLDQPIAERPTINGNAANWTAHQILSKTWHSWSWRDVSKTLPLVQMLLAHMRALK